MLYIYTILLDSDLSDASSDISYGNQTDQLGH